MQNLLLYKTSLQKMLLNEYAKLTNEFFLLVYIRKIINNEFINY